MVFKKAERKQAKLKIALTGPSGSGKTFSALLLARGIGGKVAVVDTENNSASLYANLKEGPLKGFEFDVLNLQAPYSIARYLEAMKAAEAAGYDVLITDSLSHAWAAEGGILDKKAKMDARGGNSFTNWNSLTPEQELLKAQIVGSKIHLIATMRSKQEYVIEQNDKGKQAPRKVGLAPIQRDGMEYEFTVVFDLAMDHSASASKDRTGLFDGQLFKPSAETGQALMRWLNDAKPEEPEAPNEPPKAASQELFCEKAGCTGKLRAHASGAGYLCEHAQARNDGHSRLSLEQYQAKLNAIQPAQAG
jgi:hypothetical protein